MTEPRILAPDFDGIPNSLKLLPRWILWRAEMVDGRWTKVPYRASGAVHASTSDPATWYPFDVVRRAYERGGVSGIGFCRAGSMVFIDVDGGIEPRPHGRFAFRDFPDWPELLQPRQVALAFTPPYGKNWIEVSPSGTGFHIYAVSRDMPGLRSIQRTVAGDAHAGIAVYTKARFFAITGRTLRHSEAVVDHRWVH